MKNKMLLAILVAGLLIGAACSSTAPSNTNTTTNTNTTRTTTTTNTSNTGAASNANSSTAANTNATANSGSTAQQGGAQDFTLVNQTGVEIDKVFISPHDVDDWEDDILGKDTLPSGESVDIKFSRNEKASMWDLRVEDSKGNSIEWENLNLLEINKVTLFYKDGKGTAQVE